MSKPHDFNKAILHMEHEPCFGETDLGIWKYLASLKLISCSHHHWAKVLQNGRKVLSDNLKEVSEYKEIILNSPNDSREYTDARDAYLAYIVGIAKETYLDPIKWDIYRKALEGGAKMADKIAALEHLGGSRKNNKVDVTVEAGSSIFDLIKLGKVTVNIDDPTPLG